ncbi:MAG: hypothetical protein ABR526_14120 [Chthoniobacterales bacterium]
MNVISRGLFDHVQPTPMRGAAGFTLTEILITAAVLMLVGATSTYALTLMNRYAGISRIQAAAQSAVQNQIDQILTKGPYSPAETPPDIPSVLTIGTTTTPNVTVFLNPDTGQPFVAGNMTTTVTVADPPSLNVLKVSVLLSYTYLSKPYAVTMETMRAPDK